MTDPFLLSSNDEEPAPEPRPARASRYSDDADFARYVAEIEESVARAARRWAPLVARIDDALETAGFHRHDPYGEGGGYHIATHVRDDGVLLAWATRLDNPEAPYQPDPYEKAVERIMNPALVDILTAAGFTAWQIPEDEDNALCIVVTGPDAPSA